jgi:predicted phage terminase large subunit-like protein
MRVNPLPLYQFRAKWYWSHAKSLIYKDSLFPVIGITGNSKVPYAHFKKPIENRSSVRSIDPPPGGDRHEDSERLRLELRLALLEGQEKAQTTFIGFSQYVWPEAILSSHHKIMADAFDRIAKGTLKRLIVNMPPRHTKSEFASYLLPAYIMGRKPSTKIIQATHTGELAVRFGRKVRNLMDLDKYKEVFPDVALKADSKAAGRWDTNDGGEYFAVGVGGAMTGRGADMLIIDDPHSEQDAASALALDNAWDWYTSGPRTRLQPGGAIVIVMTRWGTKDLTARLLKSQSNSNADQWEVIEFPAVFDEGEENERALWPSFWELDELRAVRASMSVQKWNAMYQQRPTADEGAILKREWWRIWDKDYMPHMEYIIQSYDTAYSKKETADFSVITTWAVFFPTEDSGPNLLLVDMRKGRWDFPDLKRKAKEQYDYWQPDNVLIEAKATGTTLQQELRRMGIPVTMYSPGGRRAGQDKVSRANSVAPIFESGMVWAPETDWADEVIEQCAAFPNGDNDDIVDSTTQALMRFRAGNFISLYSDEDDEPSENEGLVPEYY